jgi:hypothetical protein
MDQPFLYDLFTALHKDSRWPRPGLAEYFLLPELLKKYPRMTGSFEDLAFACETLWAKSPAQQLFFAEVFREKRAALEGWLDAMRLAREQKASALNIDKPAAPAEAAVKANETERSLPPADKTDQAGVVSQDQQKGGETKASPQQPESANKKEADLEYIEVSVGYGEEDGQGRWLQMRESSSTLPLSKMFLLDTEYFPVSSRNLQQDWRKLVSRQEGAGPSEPDLTGTIKRIARDGFFLDFEYLRRPVNRLSLFIFIDRAPGMETFLNFGIELARSAGDSLVHLDCKPWFFSGLPFPDENRGSGYQLMDQQGTAAVNTFSLFKPVIKQHRVVLIYSDAGAIRGSRPGEEELSRTRQFIDHLLQNTAYVAWMNPTPAHRWPGTKAAVIAREFPEIGMYEASRTGLGQVINGLKGKINFKSIQANAQQGDQ